MEATYLWTPWLSGRYHLRSTADSAIKFERFYAGSPICSPTRASFLTGRTPWRDCIFNVEYRALSTTETKHDSLGAAAKSKGYRTAHFGKCEC